MSSSPSPTPIIIGQYCADFTIDQPQSGADYYYYSAFDAINSKTYYIATARVTTNAADASTATTVRIIQNPFVLPTAGRVKGITETDDVDTTGTSQNFQEFRFKLTWNPSITPDFTSTTAVIPLDRRRYIEWRGGTTGAEYVATKHDRFVRIATADVNTSGVTFEGVAATTSGTNIQGNLVLNSNFTFASSGNPSAVTALTFSSTATSPTIQVRATALKYLILKDDFDKLNTDAVTARKQLRYLIWNNSRLELKDLYDPNVRTADIQKTAYRVSSQTNFNLNASTGSITSVSKVSSWGVDLYTHATAVSLSTTDSTAEPTNGTRTRAYETLFNATTRASPRQTGFQVGDFSKIGGSGVLLNDRAGGLQDWVITIPSLDYQDFTDGSDNGQSVNGRANIEFVFTNLLVDKSIEELFTDLHVTLLKVQRIASSPAINISATGNDNFLGLENATPSSTPQTEATAPAVTGVASGARSIDLIVRDYYKFANPVRATQFKFYDLGRGTEYLWQARWPVGSAEIYTYVGASGTALTLYPSGAITENTRGWIMEWDNTVNPPGIKLKWADTGNYLALTGTGANDSNPYRTAASLVTNTAQAAVFNCIQCSSIDSTGACLPVTSDAYLGTQNPPGGGISGRSPIVFSAGLSPIPSTRYGTFVIRFANSNYLQFSLTQVGSPRPSAFSPTSSKPASDTAGSSNINRFVFTTENGSILPSSRTATRRPVFIRSANNSNLYLKYGINTALEIASSNAPSDEDGFAWYIVQAPASPSGSSPTGASRRFYLNSVRATGASPVQAPSSDRYLLTTGTALGQTSAANVAFFQFEDLTTQLDTDIISVL